MAWRMHGAGETLGGMKLNHDPFSAIKHPPADPMAERETDLAQLPSQPQAASGPATELSQDPDVDMVDTENQPDRCALIEGMLTTMAGCLISLSSIKLSIADAAVSWMPCLSCVKCMPY